MTDEQVEAAVEAAIDAASEALKVGPWTSREFGIAETAARAAIAAYEATLKPTRLREDPEFEAELQAYSDKVRGTHATVSDDEMAKWRDAPITYDDIFHKP